MKDVIQIAIVDDHLLFQSGLASLFKNSGNIEVVLLAENGQDMIDKLKVLRKAAFPDVFVIDVNMPVMNGVDTVQWLTQNYPESKIVMLTMVNKPEVVMKLVKLGVKSYLTKDKSPSELTKAISLANENKYFFPDEITGIIIASHQNLNDPTEIASNSPSLTQREIQFLNLACSEKTYSEIAKEMHVSPRTVDAFRDSLFEKFNVKNRIGLALTALKLKLLTDNE